MGVKVIDYLRSLYHPAYAEHHPPFYLSYTLHDKALFITQLQQLRQRRDYLRILWPLNLRIHHQILPNPHPVLPLQNSAVIHTLPIYPKIWKRILLRLHPVKMQQTQARLARKTIKEDADAVRTMRNGQSRHVGLVAPSGVEVLAVVTVFSGCVEAMEEELGVEFCEVFGGAVAWGG
jgi:hypothetical protein